MGTATEDVHRLKDILVEEVSLVDRPANKRRFLLVKREGDMDELRPNGRGGFTRVTKAEEEDEAEKARKAAAEAEEEEKRKAAAKAKAPPFGGHKAPPFKKPGDEGDEDEETKAARKLLEENPALLVAMKRVFANEAEVNEERKRRAAKADQEGAKLAEEVGKLADELSDLAEKLDEEEADEPADVHMKKMIAAHKKLGGMCEKYMSKTAKKAIAKVGAKMKASRLAMYKEALQTLQSLLAELCESPKHDKEHQPDAGDPQTPPPGWKPANPSGAPTNAVGADAIKSLATVTKGMGDLVESMKGQLAAQAAEIAALKKGVPLSSSQAPGERIAKRGEDVAWPMDMNDRGRSKVDKADTFLD